MELKTVLYAGAALVAAAAILPLFLPSSVQVVRSSVIKADPGELYQLIASNEGYQTFNPYKSADPNLKIRLEGPASGVGSGFHFDGKDGKGSQFVSAVEENRSVTMAIDLGPMGKPVQKFDLEPVANGTKVIWTMDMSFGMNPIGRVMGLFMDGMVGSTFEKGLENLATVTTKSV